ncbi:MAG TPA: amino acid adenylation domain-containing protein, partial [Thermoanaerobaculia bacterium]
AATMTRCGRHYLELLAGCIAAPEQRLSELPLLSPAERHQLLVEWRDAAASATDLLHRRFERAAALTPGAPALDAEDLRLTYSELDARANRLASRLRRRGVRPGHIVGLLLERSAEQVIALLAVLKAGGAYLPLDPSYPAERLAFMVADAAVALLITRRPLLDRLPAAAGGGPAPAALLLDGGAGPAAAMDGAPGGGFAGEPWPGLPAYVIYTSGSTGKPKGVMVTHGQVTRLIDQCWPLFRFGGDDVWTLFHSFAFDFSVWEIWGALLHGGRLVVVPPWVTRSPEAFRDLLHRERVTVLNQTPSSFRQLAAADLTAPAGTTLALRWVIFGGEALEAELVRPWFDRHGDAAPRLVNMYGITETTVHVTCRVLSRCDLAPGAGGLIGRALPDLWTHLLDPSQAPVPVGVPGELCVGGAGVALGYLGRPELTAARFIPDPWSPAPGSRLYRSGDLARLRADGCLDYLGRIDHQVKVRGYRIELGEIERTLATHPAVAQAVVDVWQAGAGDRRLAAYLVAAAAAPPATAELRTFCA